MLVVQFRMVLSELVFGVEIRRVPQLDPSMPLIMFPGSHQVAKLGVPHGTPPLRTVAEALQVCARWVPVVDGVFPRVGSMATTALEAVDEGLSEFDHTLWSPCAPGPIDPATPSQVASGELPPDTDPTELIAVGFEEPTVDAARADRREEMLRYVKDADRRLRAEMKASANGSRR
jgi:hypothetical protein